MHSVVTPSAQPTVNTFSVYDGSHLLGEVSSAGAVTAAYTWGADGLVSEHLSPAGGGARSLWYLFGPQGETRQLTGSSGTVTDTYSYTAYGSTVSASTNDANPFGYGGKWGYYTETNGLILCGHRWYDTQMLRWLSRDPIGYEGGDNLYAYCNDNPVNEADEHGKQGALAPILQQGVGPLITPVQAAGAAAAAAAAAGLLWLRDHPIYLHLPPMDLSGWNPGLIPVYPAPFTNVSPISADKPAFPDRSLPRDEHGRTVPDSPYPHTQLGRKDGRNGAYPQSRQWGADGKPNCHESDTDWTDHGRPNVPGHTVPHKHRTGPGGKHGPAEPLNPDGTDPQ